MSLGPELIVNGNFDGNADGWTISNGSYDDHDVITASQDFQLFQDTSPAAAFSLTPGHTYRLSATTNLTVAPEVGFDGLIYSPALDAFDPLSGGVVFEDIFLNAFNSPYNDFVVPAGATDGVLLLTINSVPNFTYSITDISLRDLDDDPNLYLQTVLMVGAESGDVQTINAGKDDDGTPLYYELQTQEIEFGNRFHQKQISDKIVVLTEDGIDSALEVQANDGDFEPVQVNLSDTVNISDSINTEGNYFTFKWSGTASETSPVFNGLYIEKVTDNGLTEK